MKAVEEWMLWAGEKTVNLNRQKGSCPKIERDRGYNTKLFYCYYTASADEADSMCYVYTVSYVTHLRLKSSYLLVVC